MSNRIFVIVLLLSVFFVAGTALADITLTTDQTEYSLGDIVHISATNNGPEVEQFLSMPFFLILNADLLECVYGCIGLPVITAWSVGSTVTLDYDTGMNPDVAGLYTVSLAVSDSPTVQYNLIDGVTVETRSWGMMKALYR